MANTSSRALRLLSLLQNHRFWAGADLAARLEVSARTLRRDVDRLRELGYPVTAHPGVDGGYQLAPGAALPPLVLDDDEAVALVVGLRLAAQGAGGVSASEASAPGTPAPGTSAPGTSVPGTSAPGTSAPEPPAPGTPAPETSATVAEATARALAKVAQVMPARLRRRAQAVADMTESASWDAARAAQAAVINPDVLASAALACRDTERIRFGYAAASGERTERHVEPHRLVALDRRWYLVAYDLTRGGWRSFRLDRVLGTPQPTGARFRPRTLPAADAAEFVRRSITSAAPRSWAVEAVVEAPAAVIRQRLGRWATVTEDGTEWCRVTMTATDSLDWPALALGVTGADFRVVSPPELAEKIADWGARFSRASGLPAQAGRLPPAA